MQPTFEGLEPRATPASLSIVGEPVLGALGAGRGTTGVGPSSTPSGSLLSWEADAVVAPPPGTTANSSFAAHGGFDLSGGLAIQVLPGDGDVPGAPILVKVDLDGLVRWDLDPMDQPGVHGSTNHVRLIVGTTSGPHLDLEGGQDDPTSVAGDSSEASASRTALIATTIGGSFSLPILSSGTSDTWVDGSGAGAFRGKVEARLTATMAILTADIAVDDLRFSENEGGVDVSYSVNDQYLRESSTVALYWSSDLSFDPGADPLVAGSAILVPASAGRFGPTHIDAAILGSAPPGMNYLLAVADPENTIAESDETNNVRVLFAKTTPPVVTLGSSARLPIQARLMQQVWFHVGVSSGAPQPTAYGLQIAGDGIAPGGWTDWVTSASPDFPVTERLAGLFTIRAYAEFAGHRYYSSETGQTVTFPTISVIARDRYVQYAAAHAWLDTARFSTLTGWRRAEGFWITFDTATGRYGRSNTIYSPLVPGSSLVPAVPNLGRSKPRDVYRSQSLSAVYVVGWFHTNTPMTRVTSNSYRAAGPSRFDSLLSQSIPGLVYDYRGTRGKVPGGTQAYAAAKLYASSGGPGSRQLSGLPKAWPSQAVSGAVPVQRSEDWAAVLHARDLARVRSGNADVVFLGDSIVENWGDLDRGGIGHEVWMNRIAPYKAASFGVAGDTSANVLWRIGDGEMAGKPRLVVLEVGTNDLDYGRSVAQTVAGINAVIDAILKVSPTSQILVMGILPRGSGIDDPLSRKASQVNAEISQRADGQQIGFLDIGAEFLNPDGTLDTSLVLDDGIHPNALGYQLWADALAPILASGDTTPEVGSILKRPAPGSGRVP